MPEKQNVEYKESWRDEYLKWICGFANAQGGIIYIGKDDNGNTVGVADAKKLMEDIPNKVKNLLGIIVDVNLEIENNCEYIEIEVDPQPYPVSYKGEYHYRSGSTKQQLVGQQLNQFLLKKTGLTWDSVPIDKISVKDLRNDAFDIFREQAVKNKRMSKSDVSINNEELMDSLNLFDGENIKRAGILLFHHNPEKWVPGSFIKIAYFESESDIVYQDEVHGALLSQADKIVDLIYTKYLKAIISYDGITRVETYPYPKEAVREAILNAIAHKNYASLIPIQIKVFDDELIISNDCVFPEDWTVENLFKKHRSRPYNPLIANAFYRSGLIESWGRGIQKITDSCKEAGNAEPEFDVQRDEISISFKALKQKHSKTAFEHSKTAFDEEKTMFESQKAMIEQLLDSKNEKAKTKKYIIDLFLSVFSQECFGRKEIMDTCFLKDTAAGDLINKLKQYELIESVNGYGKGKYRFNLK